MKRARGLTAEIDRATDLAVGAGQPMAAGAEGLNQNQVRNVGMAGMRMGWQVVDGGRNGAEAIGARNEALEPQAEVARDELELTQAEDFVGEESRLQIKEREKDDLEDAQNEAGEGLGFENRIVAKNQESVARAVAPEVDKMINQKSFRVSDLMDLYRKAVNRMLGVFNRKIGDRN